MSLEDISRALNSEVGRLAQMGFAGLVGSFTSVVFQPAGIATSWRARWLAILTGLGFAIYIVPAAVTYFTGVTLTEAEKTVFQWGCAACYLGGMLGNNLIPVILDRGPKALGSAIDRFFNKGGGK